MDTKYSVTSGLEGEQEPAAGMAVGLAPAAGLDGEDDPTTGMEGQVHQTMKLPLCHNKEKMHKKAFIDDPTLVEKISLSDLEKEERIIGPPNYHGRFHLALSGR